MPRYRFGNQVVTEGEPEFESALAAAYVKRERPRCLCTVAGVEMYIAKFNGKHILKRLPNTGVGHDWSCDSYDPPPELSGLGQLMGSAIEENVDDGITALKLGFSLTKGGTRKAPTAPTNEGDSVKTDGNKLTLRGTLHYLWEQAEFNRWAPGMDGKRSWYVIRKFLMRALQDKRAKGNDLAEVVYIPEPFRADDKDGITQRRAALFGKIAGTQSTGRRLMILVGEVKEIVAARYGFKAVIKHVPDQVFTLNEDIHRRMQKRFEAEIGMWSAEDDVKLIMVATFGVNSTGLAGLEEVALMAVNEQWIPIENAFDKMLVDRLVKDGRRFSKGLRYNLPSNRPLAAAVLADTADGGTALYIVPPGADDDYTGATDGLIEASLMQSWIWRAGEDQMGPLPEAAPSGYRPQPRRASEATSA